MTKHEIVKSEITFLLSPKVPSGLSLRLRVNTSRCIWLVDRLIGECMSLLIMNINYSIKEPTMFQLHFSQSKNLVNRIKGGIDIFQQNMKLLKNKIMFFLVSEATSRFSLQLRVNPLSYKWLDVHSKVETPIHDSIRELITWECKEHGVKS
jgi:hypothetical protein